MDEAPNPALMPPKKGNVLLVVAIVLLAALLGVGVFIAWQLSKEKNQPTPSTESTPSSNTKPSPAATKPTGSVKKIAYIKNNSIWTVNSDGSGKNSLPKSAVQGSYRQLAWKDKNTISFLLCTESCIIGSGNVSSFSPETEANPGEFAGNTQIYAFAWNSKGDQLAYIYALPDGQMKMDFKSGNIKNTIKNFSGGFGRGGSFDDNVSISFSPDDKLVLVTNTITQPNPEDKSTVWVFEANGKEINNIESDTSWATQAVWQDSSSFIYKQGNSLYQKVVQSPNSKLLTSISPNFYNPVLLLEDPSSVYYWSTKPESSSGPAVQGPPTVGVFEDSSNKKVAESYFRPQVFSTGELIALKSSQLPSSPELFVDFTSVALNKIGIDGKNLTDLDTGEITIFAIQP